MSTATVARLPDKLKTHYHSKTEWVQVKHLEVDPRAQRRFDENWANKLAADLDPDLLGLPLVVALSGPGGRERMVIIDGQHRIAAVRIALGDEQYVECEVVRGIDLARAAALFRGRNRVRKVRAFDVFAAGRTARDPECLAIDTIVKRHGYQVRDGSEADYCNAVTALSRIYRMSAEHGTLLNSAFETISESWGVCREAVQGDILLGVALFLRRYGDELDKPSLRNRLRQYTGGPLGLLGRARSIKEALGGSVGQCVARALVLAYNMGRQQKGRIADWGQ